MAAPPGLYAERLSTRSALVAIAVEEEAVAGYALVCVEHGPDDTFPVGECSAELYSLSVAPHLRGQGIGARLLDLVDGELARRTIYDLQVAVMEANTDVRRLYERRGLRPAEITLQQPTQTRPQRKRGNPTRDGVTSAYKTRSAPIPMPLRR